LTNVTDADLKAQFELAVEIREKESATNEAVILIRELKAQIENRLQNVDNKKIRKIADNFIKLISDIEKELYQVKNQSPKDKIAFPIKLNDRLTGLRSHLEEGDGPPPKAYLKVFEDLSVKLETHLDLLEKTLRNDLPRLNENLKQWEIDPVILKLKNNDPHES
jgi:hypothetical protein